MYHKRRKKAYNLDEHVNLFMKTKRKRSTKLVKVSEPELLSLVASKLKDRELFPEKVEEAKQYLQKMKVAKG